MAVYFVSGHREPLGETFHKYEEKLLDILFNDPSPQFVVGDYQGIDSWFQERMATVREKGIPVHVTVYHMHEKPRVNHGFKTLGGFTSDMSRDMQMTMDSDMDIAFMDPGKEGSGTHQNLINRELKNALRAMGWNQSLEYLTSIRKLAGKDV